MRLLIFCCCCCILFSCGNKKGEDKPVAVNDSAKATDTLPYYDVAAAIQADINTVCAMKKPFIYRITEQNGRKDSVVIDTAAFRAMASQFTRLQLNDPAIKSRYRESVFADNDTRSYVLNYKTNDASLPVKSVSVMLDTVVQDFRRADLMQSYQRNDTLFEERLAWNVGKKFQVIRIVTAGGKELTTQTYVYWRGGK